MSAGRISLRDKVVIVDDKPRNLEAYRAWLSGEGFQDIVQLNFFEALTYLQWPDVHTLVVDGFDRDEDVDRQPWILELQESDPTIGSERYMGVRVVEAARAGNPDLVITVVSSYVDKSPVLVERFYEVGANYIYSHRDTHSGPDFIKAVRNPEQRHRAAPPPRITRVDEGFTSRKTEEIVRVLSGRRSGWDEPTVRAVRMVLVEERSMKDALEETGVSRRQFDSCMDHMKKLLELVEELAPGTRSTRLERARSAVTKLFGRHHLRKDDR
jgi:hypothetical protein